MKIVKLTPSQFDNFASSHRYRNYYQTSMYANVMSKFGYRSQFLGIVNDYNKLIGATLMIYKTIWKKYKIAYTPRGFLFNYEDGEALKTATDQLKDLLDKQNFMLLRIDPSIPLTIRDDLGNILNFNNNGSEVIDNLTAAGFKYKGKNLNFETEKPRWEAITMLQRDSEEIFARLDKRTRNKIRKAASNGIAVVKDESKSINKLFQFVDKKDKKPIDFYRQMVINYEKDIDIYYAKIKTENYVINSRRNYEKEMEYNETLTNKIQDMTLDPKEKNDYINKKMESDKLITIYKNNLLRATDLLRQKPEGIIIGGAMVIRYDNAAYIFSEGIDDDYSILNAGALLKWQIIDDYNKEGFKYVNLNGISGNFEKEPSKNKFVGLNESKLGYDATVTEYVGEFDLIIISFAYNMYKKIK